MINPTLFSLRCRFSVTGISIIKENHRCTLLHRKFGEAYLVVAKDLELLAVSIEAIVFSGCDCILENNKRMELLFGMEGHKKSPCVAS